MREAELERAILRALPPPPEVLCFKNEVGLGYRRALKNDLERSLALWPVAKQAALAALNRHTIRYGLAKGSADLVAIHRGDFVGLELKTARGRLSDDQVTWHSAASAAGARVHVVRSIDEALEVFR